MTSSYYLQYALHMRSIIASDLMLAIKTIIIVSPNWRKVLKLFRQTEVRCAIGASGDRQR